MAKIGLKNKYLFARKMQPKSIMDHQSLRLSWSPTPIDWLSTIHPVAQLCSALLYARVWPIIAHDCIPLTAPTPPSLPIRLKSDRSHKPPLMRRPTALRLVGVFWSFERVIFEIRGANLVSWRRGGKPGRKRHDSVPSVAINFAPNSLPSLASSKWDFWLWRRDGELEEGWGRRGIMGVVWRSGRCRRSRSRGALMAPQWPQVCLLF